MVNNNIAHLLEILGLEMVERFQKVLLHVVVQGVLEVRHALQGLPGLHQAGAEYGPGGQFSVRDSQYW